MIPTPHTLLVKRYSASGSDHGNTTPTYAAGVPWHVHGIAPGAMVEPGEPNRDVSLIAYTVYAPVSAELPGVRDRVTVDGVDFDVNGRPADWSRGPWAFPDAGFAVELKRVEG